MRSAHSIRAWGRASAVAWLLTLLAAPAAQAQGSGASSFTVFLRGVPIGSEQVAVARTDQGWTINSSGRMGSPIDLVLRTFMARYDADWKPLELYMDSTLAGQSATVHLNIVGTEARSAVTRLGLNATERTDTIDARAILLPNPIVGAFEAVAARLGGATEGTVLAIHQPALGSFSAEVGAASMERIQTIERMISARRTPLLFRLSGAPPLPLEVWSDEQNRLLRVSIPAQSLEFAREDVASVSARLVTERRPNDADITIPANGFSLAGTISRPTNAAAPLPAIVLVSGSGTTDRDETIAGVAVFGQVANALAEAGFLVLRYDKRGIGQSGGRPESATLTDFAEDARYAVSALWDRKDVDRKRIGLLGYGEGGWIAMIAAAKTNRVASVVLVGTVASTGSEHNLYQITRQFERSNRPDTERERAIDLQRSIQQAVITGKGWDSIGVSPAVRRQAETPYFQSFLTFDPAKMMKDLRQPLLIVQGELDRELPVSAADQLTALAKTRKQGTVDTVRIAGVNHLLVAATTGETDEYPRLAAHTIGPSVLTPIASWLTRPPAIRR
jgi:pimeloyl-ACP methyl ester carboxylesterase